jgi:hypothetical protein
MAVPDMSLPIVGGKVDLSNVVMSKVTFSAQNVGLVPTKPAQATVDVNDIQGLLDFDWTYHGPLGITFSGKANCKFSKSTLATLFTLNSDAQGRPALALNSIKVKIGQLDVKLSEGIVSWLLDLLIALFKGTLTSVLEAQIQTTAQDLFAAVLAAIEEYYPTAIPLDSLMPLLNNTQLLTGMVPFVADAQPEYAFEISPDGQYMVLAMEAGFSSTTNSTTDLRNRTSIGTSAVVNPSTGAAPMIGLTWSESLIGTLLFTLQQNGALKFEITNDDIPPESLLRLNTALFAAEWPALWVRYPNNNLTLTFSPFRPSEPPTATASAAGEIWAGQFVMGINVVDPSQPSQPIVPVAQLLLDGSLESVFNLVDNATGIYVVGKVAPLDISISVLWSFTDPGTLAPALQGIIRAIVNSLVLPLMNAVLAQGVHISTGVLEVFPLSNAFIAYGDQTASAGLDFEMPDDTTAQFQQAVRIINQFALKGKKHIKKRHLPDDVVADEQRPLVQLQ